jgi:hypothetical protein
MLVPHESAGLRLGFLPHESAGLRLGFLADREVKILRAELLAEVRRELEGRHADGDVGSAP